MDWRLCTYEGADDDVLKYIYYVSVRLRSSYFVSLDLIDNLSRTIYMIFFVTVAISVFRELVDILVKNTT